MFGGELREVLDRLWELQSEVSLLSDKERELNSKPEDFAVIDEEYQTASEEIARLRERVETFAKERRDIERNLQDEQEKLKKYQGQLMQVKNQQQYAAAWKEIDVARKSVKDLEDTLLKKMSEMEEAQQALDQRLGAHGELQERYDVAHAAWQESLGGLREEISKIRMRVETVEKRIPDKLRNDFYRILKQRQGIAVAPVVSEACGACRFKVRSQAMQQIRRGEFITCEGCRRILYLERNES